MASGARQLSFRDPWSHALCRYALPLVSNAGTPCENRASLCSRILLTHSYCHNRCWHFSALCSVSTPHKSSLHLFLPHVFYLCNNCPQLLRGHSSLFSVASLYPKRFHRPTLYGLLVLSLFNINVHSAIIAGTLLLIYAWELFYLKCASRETFVGLLIMFLGMAVTLVQLWPPPDDQFSGSFVLRHDPSIIKTMICSAFAPGIDQVIGFLLGLAVIITSLVVWLRTPVSIFVFIVTFTLYSYIIIFKWSGGTRHYGLLLIALVFCHWISAHYYTGQSILAACKSISTNWFDKVRIIQFALLMVSLFFPCYMAINEWKREIQYDFSGAKEMAKYIIENNLDAYTIAAHKAPYAAAVLPYLRTKQFWYPAEERYGSNMLWNANYRKCLNVSYPVALDRIKKNFPDRSHVLVLLNQNLSNPQYHGLKLLYSTREYGLLNSDERFFLYKFLPTVQSRP